MASRETRDLARRVLLGRSLTPRPVPARTAARPQVTTPVPVSAMSGAVLLVEDDPLQARTLSAILEVVGLTVETVATGADATTRLSAQAYDLVLLDLGLPDSSGVRICRAIKEDPSTHNVPVLVISGNDDPRVRVGALAAGADDFFVKPYPVAELSARATAAVRTAKFNRLLNERREALRSEVSLLRRWAQYLVHDLENPLAASIMNVDYVRGALAGTAGEVDEALQDVARDLRRLQVMVHDLLDAERIADGSLALKPEDLDLAEVARDVASEAVAVRASGGTVEVTGAAAAHADRGLVRRVIANLVGNAFKHGGAGKPIRIEVGATPDGAARLAVVDRGGGVPPEARSRLFTLYGRAESHGRYGYGLGLAFCRLVVEAHGGGIWIEDPSEGGAAFVIALPPPAQPATQPS